MGQFFTAQHQTLVFEQDLNFLGDIENPSYYCSPLLVGLGREGGIGHGGPNIV